ncbi:MAG: Clp protease N-terminal domain-containing protein, partial [Balneolales bacterium]
MNLNKFTLKAQEAIQGALEIAAEKDHQALEPVHILKAMISNPESITVTIIKKMGGALQVIQNKLDDALKNMPVVKGASVSGQYMSNDTNAMFDKARKEAGKLGDEYISSEHLLLSMSSGKDKSGEILRDQGVDHDSISSVMKEVRGSQKVDDPNAESRYQALQRFTRDLNELAEKNK